MEYCRGAQLRFLKGRAQLLDPIVRVGKGGLSASFWSALEEALTQHELVKVKFEQFKDQKKVFVPQMAERTQSQLILRVGHTAVFFRQHPDAEKRRIVLPPSPASSPGFEAP